MFVVIFLLLTIPASIISSVLFYYFGTLGEEDSIENKVISSCLGILTGLLISISWQIIIPLILATIIMYFLLGFITKKIDSVLQK